MLLTIPQHPGQPPQLRALFPPQMEKETGLISNVLGFRSGPWLPALTPSLELGWLLPRGAPESGRLGRLGLPPWLSLTQAADKQMSRCDLTSVAPGSSLRDAINTVLAKAPINTCERMSACWKA